MYGMQGRKPAVMYKFLDPWALVGELFQCFYALRVHAIDMLFTQCNLGLNMEK